MEDKTIMDLRIRVEILEMQLEALHGIKKTEITGIHKTSPMKWRKFEDEEPPSYTSLIFYHPKYRMVKGVYQSGKIIPIDSFPKAVWFEKGMKNEPQLMWMPIIPPEGE